MNNISTIVPPGFRFYPTDEELVDYYLRRKINSRRIDLDVIKEVDLYKIEPWDLKEICRMGNEEEQSDWYFFSHKDKKYPTGTRTNRATLAGFWKATGRDKAIYSKHELIGMRKTLVFYQGRAPNGQKSDWIMHEFRLETDENGPPQEEGWVVCRVSMKKAPSTTRMNASEHDSLCNWYDHDQISKFPPNFDSPKQEGTSNNMHNYTSYDPRKSDLLEHQHLHHHLPFRVPREQHLIHIPNFLEINSKVNLPSLHENTSSSNNLALIPFGLDAIKYQDITTTTIFPVFHDNSRQNVGVDNHLIGDANLDDLVSTDWRVLDKFVASQFAANNKETSTSLSGDLSKKEELITDNASTSNTSSNKIEVPK